MELITYQEAAAINQVSVLTICKLVQDNHIKITTRHGVLYLNKEQLDKCTITPLKTTIQENLTRYSHYYYWREAHPQASLGEANQRFFNMYGVREEKLEK